MRSVRMASRSGMAWWLLAAAGPLMMLPGSQALAGEDGDGCAHFAWNVSHELAVMKQTPLTVAAGAKPGKDVPRVRLEKLYELELVRQGAVTYAVTPAKLRSDDSAQGGLVRLRVDREGLYRVSITSGHWIDIVDGSDFIKSKDFIRARACERPSKIVEFELPPGRDLTLQLSGVPDQKILLAITRVSP